MRRSSEPDFQLDFAAQSILHDFQQAGNADVFDVVLDFGNIAFVGAAAFSELFLRETFFESGLLNEGAKLVWLLLMWWCTRRF